MLGAFQTTPNAAANPTPVPHPESQHMNRTDHDPPSPARKRSRETPIATSRSDGEPPDKEPPDKEPPDADLQDTAVDMSFESEDDGSNSSMEGGGGPTKASFKDKND